MGDLDLKFVVMQYIVLLFSLSVHEAAHAAMADRCGDPTGRLLGRVTLNPGKHIDPIGTVVMPLLMMVLQIPYLIGWARPVPFNPRNLGNIQRDPVLIALAGPASNIVIACVAMIVLRVTLMVAGVGEGEISPYFETFFTMAMLLILLNLLLAVFNMIPVPPLDGHYLLRAFLPPGGQQVLESLGPFGILIAIFVANRFLPPIMLGLQGLVLNFLGLGA